MMKKAFSPLMVVGLLANGGFIVCLVALAITNHIQKFSFTENIIIIAATLFVWGLPYFGFIGTWRNDQYVYEVEE